MTETTIARDLGKDRGATNVAVVANSASESAALDGGNATNVAAQPAAWFQSEENPAVLARGDAQHEALAAARRRRRGTTAVRPVTTPATPAERQRHRRARVAAGKRCVMVEVDAAVVEDALVRRRFLRREDADDPAAIAAALREAVRQLIIPPDGPCDTVTRDDPAF